MVAIILMEKMQTCEASSDKLSKVDVQDDK